MMNTSAAFTGGGGAIGRGDDKGRGVAASTQSHILHHAGQQHTDVSRFQGATAGGILKPTALVNRSIASVAIGGTPIPQAPITQLITKPAPTQSSVTSLESAGSTSSLGTAVAGGLPSTSAGATVTHQVGNITPSLIRPVTVGQAPLPVRPSLRHPIKAGSQNAVATTYPSHLPRGLIVTQRTTAKVRNTATQQHANAGAGSTGAAGILSGMGAAGLPPRCFIHTTTAGAGVPGAVRATTLAGVGSTLAHHPPTALTAANVTTVPVCGAAVTPAATDPNSSAPMQINISQQLNSLAVQAAAGGAGGVARPMLSSHGLKAAAGGPAVVSGAGAAPPVAGVQVVSPATVTPTSNVPPAAQKIVIPQQPSSTTVASATSRYSLAHTITPKSKVYLQQSSVATLPASHKTHQKIVVTQAPNIVAVTTSQLPIRANKLLMQTTSNAAGAATLTAKQPPYGTLPSTLSAVSPVISSAAGIHGGGAAANAVPIAKVQPQRQLSQMITQQPGGGTTAGPIPVHMQPHLTLPAGSTGDIQARIVTPTTLPLPQHIAASSVGVASSANPPIFLPQHRATLPHASTGATLSHLGVAAASLPTTGHPTIAVNTPASTAKANAERGVYPAPLTSAYSLVGSEYSVYYQTPNSSAPLSAPASGPGGVSVAASSSTLPPPAHIGGTPTLSLAAHPPNASGGTTPHPIGATRIPLNAAGIEAIRHPSSTGLPGLPHPIRQPIGSVPSSLTVSGATLPNSVGGPAGATALRFNNNMMVTLDPTARAGAGGANATPAHVLPGGYHPPTQPQHGAISGASSVAQYGATATAVDIRLNAGGALSAGGVASAGGGLNSGLAAGTSVTSPRHPSILRKRPHDAIGGGVAIGTGGLIKKNLLSTFSDGSAASDLAALGSSRISIPPLDPNRENSQSSTDTATSNESTPQRLTPTDHLHRHSAAVGSAMAHHQQLNHDKLPVSALHHNRDDTEGLTPHVVTPRKKPRKQLLNIQHHDDLKESSSTDDDIELSFGDGRIPGPGGARDLSISGAAAGDGDDEMMDGDEDDDDDNEDYDDSVDGGDENSTDATGGSAAARIARIAAKQQLTEYIDDEGVRWCRDPKKPDIKLLNHYHCNWKPRCNHFEKHSDMKVKDERRPTVNELSNQKNVHQKASGWKVHYLAAQVDELVDMEQDVLGKLSDIHVEVLHGRSERSRASTGVDEEVSRVNELAQGNIQRSKLFIDQLEEAKSAMIRILDHKPRIKDIIHKHHSKRTVKKKERT